MFSKKNTNILALVQKEGDNMEGPRGPGAVERAHCRQRQALLQKRKVAMGCLGAAELLLGAYYVYF